MGKLMALRRRFAKDERGASLVEYSILIGIITVGAIAAIGAVGTWVAGKWAALTVALSA